MDSDQPRHSSEAFPHPAKDHDSEASEDPFSPGSMLQTGSSLFGGLIGFLALFVPIAGVVSDRLTLENTVVPPSPALVHGHQ
ncbi:hypothetical protein FB106_10653 [Synechococcus sp. Ace-Pa]|nr:hypothetical protein FB106_10653 [Synechococcus sp. Ace-Pa]